MPLRTRLPGSICPPCLRSLGLTSRRFIPPAPVREQVIGRIHCNEGFAVFKLVSDLCICAGSKQARHRAYCLCRSFLTCPRCIYCITCQCGHIERACDHAPRCASCQSTKASQILDTSSRSVAKRRACHDKRMYNGPRPKATSRTRPAHDGPSGFSRKAITPSHNLSTMSVLVCRAGQMPESLGNTSDMSSPCPSSPSSVAHPLASR